MTDRRANPDTIASRISAAIAASGTSAAIVAHAADMEPQDLDARLAGAEAFTVPELFHVGGFLRITPAALMKGVAA